jgi:hypothetical protein
MYDNDQRLHRRQLHKYIKYEKYNYVIILSLFFYQDKFFFFKKKLLHKYK